MNIIYKYTSVPNCLRLINLLSINEMKKVESYLNATKRKENCISNMMHNKRFTFVDSEESDYIHINYIEWKIMVRA